MDFTRLQRGELAAAASGLGENRAFVSLDLGWYVALLASLGILGGAAISQMQRGGGVRRAPGTF